MALRVQAEGCRKHVTQTAQQKQKGKADNKDSFHSQPRWIITHDFTSLQLARHVRCVTGCSPAMDRSFHGPVFGISESGESPLRPLGSGLRCELEHLSVSPQRCS